MIPDPLGIIRCVETLIRLLYDIRHADKEQLDLLDSLNEARELNNDVKQTYRLQAPHMTLTERNRIGRMIRSTQVALDQIQKDAGVDGITSPKRAKRILSRLAWSLEHKKDAVSRMALVQQRSLSLMMADCMMSQRTSPLGKENDHWERDTGWSPRDSMDDGLFAHDGYFNVPDTHGTADYEADGIDNLSSVSKWLLRSINRTVEQRRSLLGCS